MVRNEANQSMMSSCVDESFSRVDASFRVLSKRELCDDQRTMATIDIALEGESILGCEQSQLFYERPGTITNDRLLEAESPKNSLKRALVEHYDFEVVCQRVWVHLYSWYSADVEICRKLETDPATSKIRLVTETAQDDIFSSSLKLSSPSALEEPCSNWRPRETVR